MMRFQRIATKIVAGRGKPHDDPKCPCPNCKTYYRDLLKGTSPAQDGFDDDEIGELAKDFITDINGNPIVFPQGTVIRSDEHPEGKDRGGIVVYVEFPGGKSFRYDPNGLRWIETGGHGSIAAGGKPHDDPNCTCPACTAWVEQPDCIFVNWEGRSYTPEDWATDLSILKKFIGDGPIFVGTDDGNSPGFWYSKSDNPHKIKYLRKGHFKDEEDVTLQDLSWNDYANWDKLLKDFKQNSWIT